MRLRPLLDRIVADPRLHARLLNTLARMEYVGARKIFKSRHADFLDGAGLQHALDETAHAVRLKRAAEQVAAACADDTTVVTTFSDEHTLAGHAGEGYLQGVDDAAEQALMDLPDPLRTEINYLMTSVAIEVRADSFYPVYDRVLELAGSPFRVTAIFQDEIRHLAERQRQLDDKFPGWRERIDQVLAQEELLFDRWLDAVEAACLAHAELD